MPSLKRGVARLALELGYFTGIARLLTPQTGGIGVVLAFAHVGPVSSGRLDPARTVTSGFLDRLLRALARWGYDVISLEEMERRLALAEPPKRRFVCLTFDGGYRDFLTQAYPVLARHGAPFALFVASNAPDGLADLWWLALQKIILENSRIALVMQGQQRHFSVEDLAAKRDLYAALNEWLTGLPQAERQNVTADLFGRYRIDLPALCREQCLSWPELNALAASPLATIGSATVSYPVLSQTPDETAAREIVNGRLVLEAALARPAAYFAYPFGDRGSFAARHQAMAAQSEITLALTTEPGVIQLGRTDPLSVPRIAWDGRRRSLRLMRVILTGVTMPWRRRRPGG